jgi:uncharacterized pyridoxamine 5'-phosphate oxidase family protein
MILNYLSGQSSGDSYSGIAKNKTLFKFIVHCYDLAMCCIKGDYVLPWCILTSACAFVANVVLQMLCCTSHTE